MSRTLEMYEEERVRPAGLSGPRLPAPTGHWGVAADYSLSRPVIHDRPVRHASTVWTALLACLLPPNENQFRVMLMTQNQTGG